MTTTPAANPQYRNDGSVSTGSKQFVHRSTFTVRFHTSAEASESTDQAVLALVEALKEYIVAKALLTNLREYYIWPESRRDFTLETSFSYAGCDWTLRVELSGFRCTQHQEQYLRAELADCLTTCPERYLAEATARLGGINKLNPAA